MKKMLATIAAAGLIALSILPAQATQFTLLGVNYDQLEASVSFDYQFDAARSLGIVDVGIKNLSLDNSRLTSFAFNVPRNITGLVSFAGPAGWEGRFDPNRINTPQSFGRFDVAGLSGETFGGGVPRDGIPVGETFGFVFQFSGMNLAGLDDISFLELGSRVNPVTDDISEPFIARFQRVGAERNLSDVATIQDGGSGNTSPTVVPEPSTLAMLGLGLGVVSFAARQKRPLLQQ